MLQQLQDTILTEYRNKKYLQGHHSTESFVSLLKNVLQKVSLANVVELSMSSNETYRENIINLTGNIHQYLLELNTLEYLV